MDARSLFPRTVGVLTAAYGAYCLWRPDALLRPAGLDRPASPAGSGRRRVARAIGVRDVVSGAAIVLAPAGPARRAALAARVAADLADSVGLGVAAPRSHKAKVLAVTLGWGAVGATALAGAWRDR